MSSWLKMVLVVAAFSIAAVVTGCGDEDSTSNASGSGSSSANAAFVKQANAACQKEREGSLERIGAYQQKQRAKGVPKTPNSEEEAIKAALLATVQAEIDALRALGAPAEEGEIKALLDAEQATVDDVKARMVKLSSVQVRESFAEADKEFKSQGLTGCTKTS